MQEETMGSIATVFPEETEHAGMLGLSCSELRIRWDYAD